MSGSATARWSRRGTTLVELIAAIVLLGIAVPPLVATLSAALENQSERVDREHALRLCEAVLETVLADAYGGSTEIDIVADGYADTVADRLSGIDSFYSSLGLDWQLAVEGPFDETGAVTGTDADNFWRATATVRYRAGRADADTNFSVSTLLTVFETINDPVVFQPHPFGWSTAHQQYGVEGIPRESWRWRATDDDVSVYCPWSNKPIDFEQDLGPDAGAWSMALTVKNFSGDGLPSWYSEFKVDVYVNGVKQRVNIPASDTEWHTVWFDIGEQSDEVDIQIRWKNDAWRRNTYDANIQIGGIQFAQDPTPPTGGS